MKESDFPADTSMELFASAIRSVEQQDLGPRMSTHCSTIFGGQDSTTRQDLLASTIKAEKYSSSSRVTRSVMPIRGLAGCGVARDYGGVWW